VSKNTLVATERSEAAPSFFVFSVVNKLLERAALLTWFNISFSLPIPAFLVRIVVRITLLYRRIRYGYAFRRIPLTQGYFALIDPADYPALSRYNWRLCRTKGKNTLYAERSIRLPNGKYSRILMHREVLSLPKGEVMENTPLASSTKNQILKTKNYHRDYSDGYVIDHINRNGLDNRRANLRLATVAQNAWNSKKRNSHSGYKGVCYDKVKQRWRAAIVNHGRRIHLGYFEDKIAAAKAYDEVAKKYCGQFALLNFPDEK
jgi:hypothetical protein